MSDDNSSSTISTTASLTSSNNSIISDSSESGTSSNTGLNIDVHEKFELWKTDLHQRYLLSHLLCNKRVEEKMTIENNASDAVVWNIIHLKTNERLPHTSPNTQQRISALTWLNNLKRFLNKVIATDVRMKYCNLANQPKWAILREGGECFSSFNDLVKRTKYSVGKEVWI